MPQVTTVSLLLYLPPHMLKAHQVNSHWRPDGDVQDVRISAALGCKFFSCRMDMLFEQYADDPEQTDRDCTV